MVKRRRTRRSQNWRKAPPKRSYKRSSPTSLKERFLTTVIWVLSLVNVVLIVSLVSNFFASPSETSLSGNSLEDQVREIKNSEVTVEVLNACGVQGLANEITQYLRQHDFDVVNVGNYPGGFDVERTFVFDRVSLQNLYAKRVGDVLGVKDSQVAPQLDASLQLMVTVIVGKDYKSLKLYRKN
ncbi:MAG: LytR family transcriptional regulator [Calditrichaeota bacterium]|nr:MAG: LytR family transcriptional regulator [Calditrichota bacterium]